MASLVENIETWSLNKSDTNLFRIVKNQLKDEKTDLNKLSKIGDLDIAPLHAAVASNSPELFNLVLGTEGVNPDPEYFHEGDPMGGILDFAVLRLNSDMVQLVLEKVNHSDLQSTKTCDGEIVSTCLIAAIEFDCLDLIELLLRYEAKYPKLNPIDCMILAIKLNKNKSFTKLLPKALSKINELFGYDTLLHKTVRYARVKMLRQLVEAGCDVNVKDVNGFTPFILAISLDGTRICGDGCCEQIVSELLSSKSIDLDVTVKEGTKDRKAVDYVDEKTCPQIKKLVEHAYKRDVFRKKLEKRKEQKSTNVPPKKEGAFGGKSDETVSSNRDENKICWSCSVDPDQVTLFRCKGCKVAWYCGDKCQEFDWPVHGPWCERKRNKREQKRKTKAEDTRLPEVFYDLD